MTEGSPLSVTWASDDELVVGDVTFRAAPRNRFKSTANRFCLVKRPDLVQRYQALLAELAPKRIVELGIFAGGSTALLSQLCAPEKLVAVDVTAERVTALDDYISGHRLSESVSAYFGVSQGDVSQLRALIAEEFGDATLDLVVDDASHDLDLTTRSFNVLFPLLREGGAFIIEDWAWAHTPYETPNPGETPLTKLVFQIVMACPSAPDLVSEVLVDRDWALVRRGSAPVDPATFDITSCFGARGRALLAAG